MRKFVLAAAASCLLAGCNLTTSEQAAIDSGIELGGIVGSQLAEKLCTRITKKAAALTSTCIDASGIAISIATAKAHGLIAAQ